MAAPSQSRTDADAQLVKLWSPSPESDGIYFNVILVPEVESCVQRWSESGHNTPWYIELFSTMDQSGRIFEFKYHLSKGFSWSKFVDLGNHFVDCVLELSAQSEQVDLPLIVISHGLGGIITKRALTILDENYYNPSCRGKLDLFAGLVFLGTPHPIYRKDTPTDQLDSIVNVSKMRSKEMLAAIREEVAFAWNASLRFEELNFEYKVVSAYETKMTKIPTGFFRSKREIIVNEALATTRMRLEKLVAVEADHHEICRVVPGGALYEEINNISSNVASVAQQFATYNATDLNDAWQSTPAASLVHGIQARITKLSTTLSLIEATAGSSNRVTSASLTSPKGTVIGTTPAVNLPCYMLNQLSQYGRCVGRGDILDILDKALLPSTELTTSARNRELKTFAICGLGGLGKTAIASEFASTRMERFDAVFFVSASSENKLAEHFNSIALTLGLSQSVDGENRAVNRDKVLQWLNQPYKLPRNQMSEDELPSTDEYANYLLVFDNADNPELLAEFWPIAGMGSILITSRDPHSKSHFYASRGIDLSSLSLEAGTSLLQTMTGYTNISDEPDARRLAERLGCLPLALTQVAGILQRRKLTFDEFLELYHEPSFLTEVHKSKDRGLHSAYEHMLLNVWSFEDLKPESLSLLEVCSLLDPDHISEAIFCSGGPVTLERFPGDPVPLDIARSELLRCSLLKRYPEEKEVVIHRVVQDAVRARLDPEQTLRVFSSTVNLLLFSWPSQHIVFSVEPRHWPVSGALLPHIDSLRDIQQSCSQLCVDSTSSVPFISLMVKAAWFLGERGLYEDGIKYTEAAEAICDLYPTETAGVRADLDFVISHNATFLDRQDLKLFHGERNLEYRLACYNVTDTDWLIVGIAYNEMCRYYAEIEEFEKGIAAGERALEVYGNVTMYKEKTQMPMLPYMWMAWSYIGLQRLDKAEAIVLPCLRFLESSEYHWNFNPFRTGEILYVFGNIRQAQGRIDESYELHQRAMTHYQSTIGKMHIHTAKTFMKVSEHYSQRGDHNTAIEYIDLALRSWSDRPIFDPNRARAYYRKSVALQALGNPLKAKGLLLKAEKLRTSWLLNHRPKRALRTTDDYDALVKCWER